MNDLLLELRQIKTKMASVNLKTKPELNDPVEKFITRLSQELNKINEDVMGFINVSMQDIACQDSNNDGSISNFVSHFHNWINVN